MELQLILINNQALCLHRNAPNGPVTTLKLRGEPINAVEFPSEYLERVCSQLGGVSLSQLTVSLTHDQVNEQTLRNWGMALVCAERLNVGRLRARLPRPISPHEQLELTEEGISCLSGSSRQALMSFDALGTTMSPSASLALPSKVEAPVVSEPHPAVLERLEALEDKVVGLEEDTRSLQQALDVKKEAGEVQRSIIRLTNMSSEDISINVSDQDVLLIPSCSQRELVTIDMNIFEIHRRNSWAEGKGKCISNLISPRLSGYIHFLFEDEILLIGKGGYIYRNNFDMVFAVISSDPNDTIPQIKAWLASNDIRFYQGK